MRSISMFCIVAYCWGIAQTRPSLPAPPVRLPQPASPEELAELYHSAYIPLNDDAIARLVANGSDGTCIAAAWERVRRSVRAQSMDDEADVDRIALSRFLGVVEGRLKVPLPPIWREAVGTAHTEGRKHIWFLPPDADQVGALDVATKPQGGAASFKAHGSDCVVSYDHLQWTFPCDLRNGLVDSISVRMGGNSAFVVLYETLATPYTLYALDIKTKHVLWTSKVWGDGALMAHSGGSWHSVELCVRGHHVFVFGVSSIAYIEVFDASSGENLWRFGTAYFEWPPGP